jgi:hypothetical protein
VFVVPDDVAEHRPTAPSAQQPLDGEWRLTLPGVLDSTLPGGPVAWTDLGRGGAGFAGVGVYTTTFDVGDEPVGTAILDLGELGDLARITLNGIEVGVVWTAPWTIELTSALRLGTNTLEVAVANAWMNRLIAEAASPTGEIFPPVAAVYEPDAPVQRSGLTGPVVLRLFR